MPGRSVPSPAVSSPATRVTVRTVSWMVIFFALAAAVTVWFTPRPELDAADATALALGALDSVGYEGRIDGEVELIRHETASGRRVAAWSVPVEVDGDEIELRVQRSAGRLVFVDDRIGDDDTERLLTDAQYDSFADYRDDSLLDDWVRRNAAGGVAAVLVAAVAFVIARRSDRLWRR